MSRTHIIFPDEFPEPWASDWGEDEYGLWMGFTCKGVRQDFCWIEPGTFMMGSPEGELERDNDEHQHEVTISKGFWIGDTTVTQVLWEAVMGENPSSFKGKSRPVERVSWEDARAFIDTMNGMKAELRLSLPTEAQWEYVCRAGTTTPFSFGEQISPEIVNYNGNYPYAGGRQGEYREQTVEVKSLPPNDWGLYEMHGNVLEWCRDWYGDYPTEPVVNPLGPKTGGHRVLRGGSWIRDGRRCRSTHRYHSAPDIRGDYYGFRLARSH